MGDDEVSILERIRAKVQEGEFEFSRHATRQGALRNISVREVLHAFASPELLENYPQDYYSPSCLLLGFTQTGRPCTFIALTLRVKS